MGAAAGVVSVMISRSVEWLVTGRPLDMEALTANRLEAMHAVMLATAIFFGGYYWLASKRSRTNSPAQATYSRNRMDREE